MTSLQSLESKAAHHWMEFLPEMTAELKAEGEWEQRLRSAAIAAKEEIENLQAQGYQLHEAEEVVLPKLILLEPEADPSLQWERDELAEKEARYQEMMREPEEED